MGGTYYNTSYCFCPTDASLTLSWEAGQRAEYPFQRLDRGRLDAAAHQPHAASKRTVRIYKSQSNRIPWDGLADGMIPVQEQNTGMRYRAAEIYRVQDQSVYNLSGAFSYVTGAHAIKIGGSNKFGDLGQLRIRPVARQLSPARRRAQSDHANGPSGAWRANVDADLGLFVQDRWTREQADAELRAAIRLFQQQLP